MLLSRGIESEILPTCREFGIGVTAYGVLSRGLLSGHWSQERAQTLTPSDFRASAPRFTGEDLGRNLALVDELGTLAEAYGATARREPRESARPDHRRRRLTSYVVPLAAARAVFDATARFHNPAHAPEWSDPGIDAAYQGVRSLVISGLARTPSRDT